MDTLLVLFIIWVVGKSFGSKMKKHGSNNQTLKSMPVQKDPYEERAKQKPMTGEAIQARKQALKKQYADKMPQQKQEAPPKPAVASMPADRAAGAFGVQPLAPMEGVDPCHDELYDAPAAAQTEETVGWEPNFAFDRKSLVQAVVMQEILTRPCQRQRRGFR